MDELNIPLNYYIGLAGIEGGVYLCNAIYFCLSPFKGRLFRGYTAAMCFAVFISMLFDIYSIEAFTNYEENEVLFRVDHMIYFFAVPMAATLLLSIIIPQKSKWWFLRFCLFSELGPIVALLAFLYWQSDLVYNISWGVTILYCLWFFVFGEYRYLKYEKAVKNMYSNTEGHSAAWVQKLIMLFTVSMVFYVISASSPSLTWHVLGVILDITTITAACFYIKEQKPANEYLAKELETESEKAKKKNKGSISVNADRGEGNLDDTEEAIELSLAYSSIAKNLKKMFEGRKLFLQPDITSTDVAKAIGTNERYLSYFLNNVMGKTFHSYIRELRTEHAKNLLESWQNYQLNDIASQSGFSSLTTFSSAFKSAYGMAPMMYRQEYVKEHKEELALMAQNAKTEEEGKAAANRVRTARKRQTDHLDILNKREKALCELIMKDKSNDEIATTLDISRESLRVAKSRILKKLDPEGVYHDLKKCLMEASFDRLRNREESEE